MVAYSQANVAVADTYEAELLPKDAEELAPGRTLSTRLVIVLLLLGPQHPLGVKLVEELSRGHNPQSRLAKVVKCPLTKHRPRVLPLKDVRGNQVPA
jgi:hypothetical protein